MVGDILQNPCVDNRFDLLVRHMNTICIDAVAQVAYTGLNEQALGFLDAKTMLFVIPSVDFPDAPFQSCQIPKHHLDSTERRLFPGGSDPWLSGIQKERMQL